MHKNKMLKFKRNSLWSGAQMYYHYHKKSLNLNSYHHYHHLLWHSFVNRRVWLSGHGHKKDLRRAVDDSSGCCFQSVTQQLEVESDPQTSDRRGLAGGPRIYSFRFGSIYAFILVGCAVRQVWLNFTPETPDCVNTSALRCRDTALYLARATGGFQVFQKPTDTSTLPRWGICTVMPPTLRPAREQQCSEIARM